jgi:hypothetical protein
VVWDCREADSELGSTGLRPRQAEHLEPVPVHPKDIFCFFRDWRLPRPTKAREEDENSDSDQRERSQKEAAVGIQDTSTAETKLHEHNGSPAENRDRENGVLCLQGPLTDAERKSRKGQSYLEVIPNPDGTQTIAVSYGDDIANHAAHIAQHQRLTERICHSKVILKIGTQSP